ncbi:VOC family protein [Lachnospiraceae bacterium 62-35]
MKLKNVLIVVNDIERSKRFYQELFGLDVVLDHGGNVILTEGLVLQEASIWKGFLNQDVIPQNNASELYFEESDLEGFVKKLENYKEPVQYINRLMEHSWGQKVVRFYDPDGNLIEVGTPMSQMSEEHGNGL